MPLTTREVELLRYLAANPSRVIPRDELLAQVWGYAGTVMSRASDNTVRRLREKIERDPAHPDHLLTVHGVGYRFEPLPPAQPVQALVGRAQLVAEVGARLAPGRWVLLVGPGGVGKSALARACAPDATWVDLGGAATLHEAAAQAARALGIELGADDPVDRVGRALTGRTGRLVLDHADGLGPALLARWG
ncbi:MAG: winged helix-turn-helix domain-containing protein, partial [Myxococcota bacterium]